MLQLSSAAGYAVTDGYHIHNIPLAALYCGYSATLESTAACCL